MNPEQLRDLDINLINGSEREVRRIPLIKTKGEVVIDKIVRSLGDKKNPSPVKPSDVKEKAVGE